jgi:uncharacterized protein (DUF1697 family)
MASVVFLRGVNVGGHKTFQPSLVAKNLSHLGVINVGAAGTFVIPAKATRQEIQDEFAGVLPWEAELMICSGKDLLSLHASDPFAQVKDFRPFVQAMSGRPRNLPALPFCHPSADSWEVKVIGVSGIFALTLWRKLGKTLIDANAIVEKNFGVRATTRNWNTIVKICAVLRQQNA